MSNNIREQLKEIEEDVDVLKTAREFSAAVSNGLRGIPGVINDYKIAAKKKETERRERLKKQIERRERLKKQIDNTKKVITSKESKSKSPDQTSDLVNNVKDTAKEFSTAVSDGLRGIPGVIENINKKRDEAEANDVKEHNKQVAKQAKQAKQAKDLEDQKKFKLTPTTKVIGGTALAAGLGLGAHYLYKKYKKNKKIRASMKKKM